MANIEIKGWPLKEDVRLTDEQEDGAQLECSQDEVDIPFLNSIVRKDDLFIARPFTGETRYRREPVEAAEINERSPVVH